MAIRRGSEEAYAQEYNAQIDKPIAQPICPACQAKTVRARVRTKDFICIRCGHEFKDLYYPSRVFKSKQ